MPSRGNINAVFFTPSALPMRPQFSQEDPSPPGSSRCYARKPNAAPPERLNHNVDRKQTYTNWDSLALFYKDALLSFCCLTFMQSNYLPHGLEKETRTAWLAEQGTSFHQAIHLWCTDCKTLVHSLGAVGLTSCHSNKSKCTFLNMHLCCDQGDRFMRKTRLSDTIQQYSSKLDTAVGWAAFKLDTVRHKCCLAYEAQPQWGDMGTALSTNWHTQQKTTEISVMMKAWHMLTAGAISPHSTHSSSRPPGFVSRWYSPWRGPSQSTTESVGWKQQKLKLN